MIMKSQKDSQWVVQHFCRNISVKIKINYVRNEVTQVPCQQHHMVSDIYVPTRVDNSAMFFTSSQYMVLRKKLELP